MDAKLADGSVTNEQSEKSDSGYCTTPEPPNESTK
jgi:hypothetical protein